MTGTAYAASCVVFVDADNTLWDTNLVYAEAQTALLTSVESLTSCEAPSGSRLDWIRKIDQALAKRHHAKLRYPPRLLAKAAALALVGQDISTAVRLAWSGGQARSPITDEEALRIEHDFQENLARIPRLRDGVRAGLQDLKKAGCHITVLTEASRKNVVKLLKHHGLYDLVDRVIEAKKECQLFKRVFQLTHETTRVFMVGDQLKSDIQPAQKAGFQTIYFPGGFRPGWEPTESAVRPDYRIKRFDEITSIVIGGSPQEIADASH